MCAEESAAEVCSGLLAPVSVGGSSASGAEPFPALPAAEVGVGAGEGEEEKVEDAVVPKPAPSPCTPSRVEREAREATHLPCRSWCAVCVQGRAANPQHRRSPPHGEGERRLPEVRIDYAFLRRADAEDLAKLVVLMALPSRAMRAWVVPSKGAADGSTVERVFKGIREMGIRAPCIVKCDGEPAVEALREELMNRMGEGVAPPNPPVGESQSNGVVENGARLLKDMVRVHVLPRERKLQVRIPAGRPMIAWVAESAGDLVTKHLRGQDGRTGYERLFGKAPREEGLELGEMVLRRRPKQAGMNVLLEARWEQGIRLGRRWGGVAHLVGAGKEVFETRAVQRRPEEERWDVAAVQGPRATPWRNPAPEEDDQELVVLPPRADAPPPPVHDPSAREGPKQVYIRDTDIGRYGLTANCRRCNLMRAGHAARGVRHIPACRARIEAAMADAGDDRLDRAHQRRDGEVARRLEAADAGSVAARPAEGVEIPAVVEPVASPVDEGAGELAPAEPNDVQEDVGRAEEMHIEGDNEDELIEALTLEGVSGLQTRRAAREANQLFEMLLIAGVSRGDAAMKITELFSPPRVTAELGRLPQMSLVGGSTST